VPVIEGRDHMAKRAKVPMAVSPDRSGRNRTLRMPTSSAIARRTGLPARQSALSRRSGMSTVRVSRIERAA
jgi:hypothetical protein